jgi:hypothetical protein
MHGAVLVGGGGGGGAGTGGLGLGIRVRGAGVDGVTARTEDFVNGAGSAGGGASAGVGRAGRGNAAAAAGEASDAGQLADLLLLTAGVDDLVVTRVGDESPLGTAASALFEAISGRPSQVLNQSGAGDNYLEASGMTKRGGRVGADSTATCPTRHSRTQQQQQEQREQQREGDVKRAVENTDTGAGEVGGCSVAACVLGPARWGPGTFLRC